VVAVWVLCRPHQRGRDCRLHGCSKLATIGTDEVYAAMEWLGNAKRAIENKLAQRHLGTEANPSRLAYFDLSSSWVEGSKNELAARGHSRDKKRGLAQIEYGLLTDNGGRSVAVEEFPGIIGDPTVFISTAEIIRTRYLLERLTMVGDRSMITSARITAPREVGRPRVIDLPARSADRRLGQRRRGPCSSASSTNATWPSSTIPNARVNG
jgi:hypothetical protein